jgi:hypothetical protein
MTTLKARVVLPALLLVAAIASPAAAPQPALSKEEMRQFLLTAEVVKSRNTPKGITSPWRLTLSDGKMTHDAAFQSIDQRKTIVTFSKGTTEINFTDSYRYNIAAYALAELLGLDHMVPVTIERRWRSEIGSLSWWVDDVMMDEADRVKKKVTPPDSEDWSRQILRMRVFTQLVYDTDRNLTNNLISAGWKLWMIDFSRAFRMHKELKSPAVLTRCDRQLLERLRQLTFEQVLARTKPHLWKEDVQALLARRDRLVAHFDKRIAAAGEKLILY